MSKTQAELDAAVIQAAENVCEWWKGKKPFVINAHEFLNEAVRARREAMRPHKAAVLRKGASNLFKRGALEWRDLTEEDRLLWRNLLAEILSAPDEEPNR